MVIEKHVGKTVLLNIREEFASSNGSLIQSAVNTKLFYVKVVDFDSYGLWVENPNGRFSLKTVALQKAIKSTLSSRGIRLFRLPRFLIEFLKRAKFLTKREYPLSALSREMAFA